MRSVADPQRVTSPRITSSAPASEFFDIQARPGYDSCAVESDNEYNRSLQGRALYNTYGSDRDTLIGFSSGSRNLRFGDGVGQSPPDMIDEASRLRHGYGWHPRGRNQLKARVYQGPADLSGGYLDRVDEETGVSRGDSTFDRHTALAGVSIDRFDPLLPDMQRNVQNHEHIVPTAWVRGGQDTRAQTRTLSYIGSQGFSQASGCEGREGTAWVLPPPK